MSERANFRPTPNSLIATRQLPSAIKETPEYEKKINQVLMLFGSLMSAEHVSTAVELILRKDICGPIHELLFHTQSKVERSVFKATLLILLSNEKSSDARAQELEALLNLPECT